MPNYFSLTLDTTGPSNPSIIINGGATYASTAIVTCTIGTGDAVTTGYQMKIWGDVDLSNNSDIQDTEANSNWISYSASQQVKLSSGNVTKTLNLKLRDSVLNESSVATDQITLDSSLPTVIVAGQSTSEVGTKPGADTCTFTFTASTTFEAYEVKVVNTNGDARTEGTVVPITNGSANTSGSAGGYDTSSAPITVTIKGEDVKAISPSDGQKIIKVFVQNIAGNWSA
jgi:hypothetical protein